jgi:hypothetical protein
MYQFILPLGILNFLLALFQILTGLKIVKVRFKIHKITGILLGVFALIHGTIAIFFI